VPATSLRPLAISKKMSNIQLDEALLIGWLFILGAVIGSFLNVVIYRLPQGMSLIVPPSHCPRCEHRIRWYDNIPIVSWLLLGRKCRDCHAPISARYPLVEALTASMFALLAAAEFTFKGINLPPLVKSHGDSLIIISRTNTELYQILLFHLLLLCTLLVAALIEFDGHPAPRRLFMPALAIGLIVPLICPYLRPMPAWPGIADWPSRILDCAAGIAAGGLLGYLAWRIKKSKSPGGVSWELACVGIFLGWQACCGIAVITMFFALVAYALGKIQKKAEPWPVSIWLYSITLGWILAWSQIVEIVK
jgi:leader peptidase (prepilin peptidase) / N-methyltransferase